MTIRSLHIAQTPANEPYDPRKVLPYPYHIEENGIVGSQEFWKGDPARLLGFQNGNVQRIVLTARDWWQGAPEAAQGLHPVFVTTDGDMWAETRPVTSVSVI